MTSVSDSERDFEYFLKEADIMWDELVKKHPFMAEREDWKRVWRLGYVKARITVESIEDELLAAVVRLWNQLERRELKKQRIYVS